MENTALNSETVAKIAAPVKKALKPVVAAAKTVTKPVAAATKAAAKPAVAAAKAATKPVAAAVKTVTKPKTIVQKVEDTIEKVAEQAMAATPKAVKTKIETAVETGKATSKIVKKAGINIIGSSLSTTKKIVDMYKKAGKKAVAIGKEVIEETMKIAAENQKSVKATSMKAFKESVDTIKDSNLMENPLKSMLKTSK